MNLKPYRSIRLSTGIFLLTLGILLVSLGGHTYVKDGVAMFFMTDSIATHGWFDVPVNPNTLGGRTGPDNRYYTPFGILQPLLAVPFYLMGRWLTGFTMAQYTPAMTITMFNATVTALLPVLLTVFLRDLGVTLRRAVFCGLALVFSTPFWIYSRTFFSDPFAAFVILFSAWSLFRYSKFGQIRHVWIAGTAAAFLLIIRPLAGVAYPALFLYLVMIAQRRKDRPDLKPFLIFGFMLSAGIALYLAYNYIRFGSFFETGYDLLPSGQPRSFTLNPVTGLKILLFSPGKSLFIFVPCALGAIAGIGMMFKSGRHIAEGAFILTLNLLFLLTLSQWARVEGGVAWGPRLMMPAIPVLFLALAPLLKNRRLFKLVVVLAVIGFFIQIPGLLVNFSTYIYMHANDYFNPMNGIYRFEFNPFPGQTRLVLHYLRDLGNLAQLDPQTAAAHRALTPINYVGSLDLWFIHFWQDRVPTGFIVSLFIIACAMIGSGLFLLKRAFAFSPIPDSHG